MDRFTRARAIGAGRPMCNPSPKIRYFGGVGPYITAAAESTENRAGFSEGEHAGNAEFASKARQLEATRGRLRVIDHFVDHHPSRLQAVRGRKRASRSTP